MVIRIQDELRRLSDLGLLEGLLADRTTGGNILWGTDAYGSLGPGYRRDGEMQAALITGARAGLLKNRAAKAQEQQAQRTKQHAEVFTPLWVCAKMNGYADELWSGGGETGWQQYVDSRRLEITCGEAPFLVSRYDVTTGESVPLEKRIGVLDRKLRAVDRHAETEEAWLAWALRAFRATYGYEFQGDNLLIARVNLLATFEEYLRARWRREPTAAEYAAVTDIVTWNLWQMDGLTGAIPFSETEENTDQLSLFDWPGGNDPPEPKLRTKCVIYDWRNKKEVVFADLPARGNNGMKFDFIIGNPPYQEELFGTSDKPVYNYFMDASYKLSDKVELISPGRFLFNAGKTPKVWNKKMLNDEHLKVLYYEQDSSKVFANTDIKGGVAVTYRDTAKQFGAIEYFISENLLRNIVEKVKNHINFAPLSKVINGTEYFKISKKLYEDFPDLLTRTYISKGKVLPLISKGHEADLTSNILDKIPEIFYEKKPNDDSCYCQVCGRQNNKRVFLYFKKEYLLPNEGLDSYKVIIPESNNNGTFGETLVEPFVANKNVATTQTFLTMGFTKEKSEADALLKYICGKFARAMLGTLKITQHNKKETWRHVPLQDFTPSSDIDWTKSIPEIDQQLYAKYGLSEAEIAFIESHVKEMT